MTNEDLTELVDKMQGTMNKMQDSMDSILDALGCAREIAELQSQRIYNIEHKLGMDRP